MSMSQRVSPPTLCSSLKIVAVSCVATSVIAAAANAEGFGEAEFRFGVAETTRVAQNPSFVSAVGGEQIVGDFSIGYQIGLDNGFGFQFDLDHTRVDNDNSDGGVYGATAATIHGFADISPSFSFGAFATIVAAQQYDGSSPVECDDPQHLAVGVEGQLRLANGVVVDALYGKSNLFDAPNTCDGYRWDGATFVDLGLTVPISDEWSVTGGYFASDATVQGDDPAEKTEIQLGTEYDPAGTDWTFLAEISRKEYYQTQELDRSEIDTIYLGARLDFGASKDTRRPLLSNVARPLGRAIALSPDID